MPNLLIIEKVTPQLVEFVKSQPLDSHLLLVTPEALAAFRDSALKTHLPEDFVRSEELNQLGLQNFARIRTFVSEVDKYIESLNAFVKDKGIKFAFYHFDMFKINMDTIMSRVLILDAAIKKLKPTQIYYTKCKSENINTAGPIKESVYSLLVQFFSKRYNISVNTYPFSLSSNDGLKSPLLRGFLNRIYACIILNLNSLRYIRYAKLTKNHSVLSINPGYDHDVILKSPEVLRNFEVWVCKDSGLNTKHTAYMKAYCRNNMREKRLNFIGIKDDNTFKWDSNKFCKLLEQLEPLCIYNGINWFPLMKNGVEFFLRETVPASYEIYLNTKNLLRLLSPDCVMSNSGVTNIQEGSVIKAIRDYGIPFIMMQHGGGGYGLLKLPNVAIRDFEQVPSSHYLFWGEGIAKYFRDDAEKNNVIMHPVGSPTIRKIYNHSKLLKKKDNIGIKTIFYILQPFRDYHNKNYYPGGAIHYTDTWYFNLQSEIVEIFKKYDSYRFVFKVPQIYSLQHNLYSNLVKGTKHIRIETSPLLKCIDEADLFIIDTLATSIIQCAATAKPIIVYTGEHCRRPNPEALVSLRKRAVCCETKDDYLQTIDTILNKPDTYSADPNNCEFINQFGISGSAKDPDWNIILERIINNRSN